MSINLRRSNCFRTVPGKCFIDVEHDVYINGKCFIDVEHDVYINSV